jgi:hypothetical protein
MIVHVNGIVCPVCLDVLWSRSRHDFRSCTCRYCFVDGGRDYLRYGAGCPETGELLAGMPKAEIVGTLTEDGRFHARSND